MELTLDSIERIMLIVWYWGAIPLGIFMTVYFSYQKYQRSRQLRAQRNQSTAMAISDNLQEAFALTEFDEDWEACAVRWFRQEKELSAIELVQQQTGLDFEKAKVKLLKLDEEITI